MSTNNQGQTPLPAKLAIRRTHPNKETRDGLIELVNADKASEDFGNEEAVFFGAHEGSERAAIAQACVDRYNNHAALVEALKKAYGVIVTINNGMEPSHSDVLTAIEESRAAYYLAQS